MSEQTSWVDDKFVQRLQTRMLQPGVVRFQMGHDVVSRVDRMTQPQSLVQVVGQRWHSTLAAQADQIPFVYAQPPQPEQPPPDSFHSGQSLPKAAKTNKTAPLPVTVSDKPAAGRAAGDNELVLAAESRPAASATAQPTAQRSPGKTGFQSANASKPKQTAVSPASAPKPPLSKPDKTGPTTSPAAVSTSAADPVAVAADLPQPNTGLADLPLPVVKAQQVKAPSIVTPLRPKPQTTGTVTKSTPVSPKQAAGRAPVIVPALPTAEPARPVMPVVNREAQPPVPKKNTSAKTTAHTPPTAPVSPPKAAASRPLVKPQAAAPRTTPSFPVPAPKSPMTSPVLPPGPADNPLPVVRSGAVTGSQTTAAMPLPKTAVTTPGSSSTAATASTPSAGSGVIQRRPAGTVAPAAEADNGSSEQAAFDIDEIVAEVQRQFKRELAIEGERRGAASWY